MNRRSAIFLRLIFTTAIAPYFLIPVDAQSNHASKFEQLGSLLRDANQVRGIDGGPGPAYWQQRCDYNIECQLDVEKLTLYGDELVTYYNQSPNSLRYLWLQLDENQHSISNDNQYADPSSIKPVMSEAELKNLETWRDREDYGFRIDLVSTENGQDLPFTINQTMMRLDLPNTLQPGEQYSFRVKWHYKIIDRIAASKLITGSQARNLARGGYELFEDDGNYLFTMTQWYPRLCVYSDFEGWQNKQFTGRGEFALTFGNFVVKMTVPGDHVVGATGECLNYPTVLSKEELARWNQARESQEPMEIVTYDEAVKTEKS
ncbi:MAG: M1 family peptidase, partial [Saprospiraceae bacterium]|nr:M1 family peptidase [Saprospiraceae bacterium]